MSDEVDLPVVSVLTEVAALDRAFDYEVPPNFIGPLAIGSRVRVPLHGRSVRGWVVGPGGAPVERKLIARSLGIGPPPEVVDLCQWAAWRWASTQARFLGTASPDRLVTGLPVPPSLPAIDVATSPLSRLGAEAGTARGPVVVEIGPATDPFELLLGVLMARRDAVAAGGTLLVIVPGRGYAQRVVGRLGRRGIPAVDLADGWDAARAGWPVVVGTRTAALAPVPTVAGIVVLDADDERLRSEGAPTWSAVDLAIERSARCDGPAVLVSSCLTPSLAMLASRVVGGSAALAGGWPRVTIADRRGADPRTGRYSEELVVAARRALAEQPQGVAVACILNRTGRARLLACRSCAELVRCDRCDAAVALTNEALTCPRCGATRPVVCVHCGATAMKVLRAGTAQVAEDVEHLLGVPVGEMTATSDDVDLARVRCVVGTEAVLHRLRRTRLVVILDLDASLLAPRAGAELESLRLIGRAGRLVGGRADPEGGMVLVQTRLAHHPVLTAAQSGMVDPVIAEDLAVRTLLNLPPARACAVLKGAGAQELAASLEALGLEARPLHDDRQAILAPTTAALCDALKTAGRPKGRVTVAVDQEPD